MLELETFGGVHRHHRNPRQVLERVSGRLQRDAGQVLEQRRRLARVASVFFVVADRPDELIDVVEACVGLGVVLELQPGTVAALFQYLFGEFAGRSRVCGAREGGDHVVKAEERVACGLRRVTVLAQRGNSIERGGVRRIGDGGKALEGLGAELACGHVDDSEKIDVALRVDDEAQVREQILYLGAVEKLRAPDDLIRDVFASHRLLEDTRLRMNAIKHSEIARGCAFCDGCADALDNEPGFIALVCAMHNRHGIAGFVCCPKLFRLALA